MKELSLLLDENGKYGMKKISDYQYFQTTPKTKFYIVYMQLICSNSKETLP